MGLRPLEMEVPMTPNRPKSQPRRRPLFRIEPETLEGRQLLTGGAGNTIALSRGNIAAAGGSASSAFVISSSHFTMPKGRMTLGVDVVSVTGSSVNPRITAVTTKDGHHLAIKGAQSGAKAINSADLPHAVLATVNIPRKKGAFTAAFESKIAAQAKTSGDFLIGYYLPGDANGDGKVTQADVTAIRKVSGTTVNDAAYLFDADSNRDGVISAADVTIARQNLGVTTTITPDFTANLDPASDTGASDRITNTSTVTFTGDAAPGAKIVYDEVNGKAPTTTTTASTTGKYTVTIPLTEGTSTFKVSSTDSFGQTISGSIQPVTYTTGTVPQATSTS